ncbi:MAG: cob(I)yrinic acid a,c-diamide adenosyltransferase [Candidatus Pacebacteria bacterium]|nr:cob(I)yrinic acid a,c-diamide adenosyltransferase [Candidatus Paceibacterota bacterium]
MSIYYTGKGDKGKSFVCHQTMAKTSAGMEAMGELDELNSLIGLIRSQKAPADFKNILKVIQENLFLIQASVAKIVFSYKLSVPRPDKDIVKKMEKVIDLYSKKIGQQRGFVISGENELSAWLDFARAVARRAERGVLKLKKVDPIIFAYLNRLSSLLFVLARVASKRANKKENSPLY